MGLASASAVAPNFDKRVISIMGDGGFWHNGINNGVANALFNQDDGILMIMKNGYTSATGWQHVPSTERRTVLEGDGAIGKNREVMGATNPADANPGTIGAEFAESVGENSVHGSDAPETAAAEISYFFSGLELVG